MDIPLVGGNFTWSNNLDCPSWSGIDRFPLFPDWEAWFPYVSNRKISRILLDHFPLLLVCDVVVKRSLYFKFENI